MTEKAVNMNIISGSQEKLDRDEALESLKKEFFESAEVSKEITEDMRKYLLDMINNRTDEFDNIDIKKIALALGYSLVSLAALLSNGVVEDIALRSAHLAESKVIPSLMPKLQDGNIIDNDFLNSDLELSTVMMTIGFSVEQALWRERLGAYQDERSMIEKEQMLAREFIEDGLTEDDFTEEERQEALEIFAEPDGIE